MGTNAPSSAPVDLLLSRLERVRKCGRGYIAKCPAHDDRSASLSVAEGDDGRALLRCFATCTPLEVVQAVGLTLADLFVAPVADMSPAGRAARREAKRQADWAAALAVLRFEAQVVLVAARSLVAGGMLQPADLERLQVARDRVDAAAEVLL
jgi:hypothetical protein